LDRLRVLPVVERRVGVPPFGAIWQCGMSNRECGIE
jgi:hypothetical protein